MKIIPSFKFKPAPWTMMPLVLSILLNFLILSRTTSVAADTQNGSGSFRTTAYSPAESPPGECGPYIDDGRSQTTPHTASGPCPQAGVTIAVDPRVIGLGVKVCIDGVGTRTAQDTGGDIKGNWIDIFVTNSSEMPALTKSGVHVTWGNQCENTPPSPPPPPAETEIQKLAKEILANSNIVYPLDGSSSNGSTKTVLQVLADGGKAPVACLGTTTDINVNILKFVAELGGQTTIGVNALTDKCHSSGSHHYIGQAVDFECRNVSFDTTAGDDIAAKYNGKRNSETCSGQAHWHYDFLCDGGQCHNDDPPPPPIVNPIEANPGITVESNPYDKCADPHPELRKGSPDDNDCVHHLQWYLYNIYGYYNARDCKDHGSVDNTKICVDGSFGNISDRAVKDFQTKHGLAPSGVVDAATWDKLHGVTTTELSVHPNPAGKNQRITLTALVRGSCGENNQPGGRVEFSSQDLTGGAILPTPNPQVVGQADLSNGTATIVIEPLPVSSYKMFARYEGSQFCRQSAAPVGGVVVQNQSGDPGIVPQGSFSGWHNNPYPLDPRFGHVSVALNGYMYVINGISNDGTASPFQFAKINDDGTTGLWQVNPNYFPLRLSNATAVAANGYIYVMGGDTQWSGIASMFTNAVYYTKVNPDGTTGPWLSTTSLPIKVYTHSAVELNGYLYVIGGIKHDSKSQYGDSANTDVYYTKLNPDGQLGAWKKTKGTEFGGWDGIVNYHTWAATNGKYIYVASVDTSTIYYAEPAKDGSIPEYDPAEEISLPNQILAKSNWRTLKSPPVSMGDPRLAIYGNTLYVLGNTIGDSPDSSVLYANIKSDGKVDSWVTASGIPRYNSSIAQYSHFLYLISGEQLIAWSGNNGLRSDVFYSDLVNRTGL